MQTVVTNNQDNIVNSASALNGKMSEAMHQAYSAQEPLEATPEKTYLSDGSLYFYTSQDARKLQNSNLNRVRELQGINDNLQRQINLIIKALKDPADDGLALLAEKERLQILLSRNAGEIIKIHVENEERLRRIAKLEAENKILHVTMVDHRDSFVETRQEAIRTHFATEYFLAKSKIEKNSAELEHLTKE